jgi:putative hydrolase of the HAD superfamily
MNLPIAQNNYRSKIIGFAKPDLRFFEIACEMTNTPPHECLFIGDDLEVDILPCHKMNLRGIWLNRQNKPQIHHTVESITALSELKRFLAG